MDYSAKRIIRKTEVLDLVGLSDTTLWRLEKKNEFPKRLRLGGNSVGWHEGEVLAWIQNRPRCAEEVEESAIRHDDFSCDSIKSIRRRLQPFLDGPCDVAVSQELNALDSLLEIMEGQG